MDAAEEFQLLSIEAYLAMEDASEVKHEYIDGWIRSMSGGTRFHSLIKVNLIAELRQRLRGRSCQPYDSDFRIAVLKRRSYFYPDASIICGPLEFDKHDKNAATNPTVIIEVLSPNTEHHDKGDKLVAYRDCPTLRDYVVVHQRVPIVEVYHHNDAGEWIHTAWADLKQSAIIRSANIELPLASLFENIEFPPPDANLREDEAGYYIP